MVKIGINGFGRIGRSVFRVLNNREDIEVVAINDIFDKDALTYLLKYDTVMGRFPENVSLEGDILKTESESVKLIAERDPTSLPWGELGVDIVIESTGIFRQKSQLENHLKAGAKRVVLTVPSKDDIESFPDLQNGPSSLIQGSPVAIHQVDVSYTHLTLPTKRIV